MGGYLLKSALESFQSLLHMLFIDFCDTGRVNTERFCAKSIMEDEEQGMKVTTILALLVISLLLVALGFAAGRLTAEPTRVVAPSTVTAPTADAEVPPFDVPGEDIPGLPPFPGATRVEYRQVVLGDLLETEAEYVMTGDIEPVHDFYRDVFDAEGWTVADLGIYQGEWTFFLINGAREALVELEARGSLIEVEIEYTEPLPAETGDAAQP